MATAILQQYYFLLLMINTTTEINETGFIDQNTFFFNLVCKDQSKTFKNILRLRLGIDDLILYETTFSLKRDRKETFETKKET